MDNGIIGDYLLLKAGKAMPADRILSSKADGMFPCFGGNGIRGYVDSYNYDGDYAIIGRQGALCGNVCLAQGKFYATEHAVVVTPKAIVDSTWLFFALNQMNLNQYARGVAQPGLAVNELEKLPFSVPDINKQIEFSIIAKQADKSKFMRSKSQFIEMFGGNKVDYVQLSSLCSTFIDGDWIESKDQSESGIRLIQTGNVGCGEYKDKGDKAKYITEDTFNKLHCTEIYPGDILISRLPDPVGRACVLPEGLGKCVTAVDCTIIRFSEKILPNFFVAYTNTPEYLTQIKSTLAGTTRLRVSRGNLGKVKIPVPSIEQQRTFVSIAEQADKSKLIGLLWKHCHCRDVYTK